MKYVWLVWLLCACGVAGAQNKSVEKAKSPCTFFDEFIDNSDGTVTDPRNGVVWKRCAEGQTWEGNACTGKAIDLNLPSALKLAQDSRFLDKETWRLPSKSEFEKVLGTRCDNNNWKSGEYAASAMLANPVAANGSVGKFWTPQTLVGKYDSMMCGKEVAYVARFFDGQVSADYNFAKCDGVNVRLVRSSTAEEQAARNSKLAAAQQAQADKLAAAKQVQAENLALARKLEVEQRAAQLKQSMEACARASVPNSHPLPHESTDYYGACSGGTATTGVVIWKIRGEPVDISCLSQGSYVSSSTVDAFEACGTYLPMIPNYCSVGNYKGQCVDSKPQGVGYMSSRGSTISMKRGMFSNGQLQGYGYSISKGGCGPAGCSGNLLNQVGWFDADVLQTSCSNFVDCLGSISGKTYSNFLSTPKSPELMAEAARLRSLKTFDGAMEAFQIAGDRNDLKAAQSLAQSPAQKSQLELQLLRIAGLNKVFDLQARVQIGKQAVPINEHDKLLGFVRGVDSDLPVKVLWSIGAGNAALNPKAGPYRLSLTAGLNVQTSHRSCFLGFCSTRQDVDRYAKTIDIVLSSSGRYKASGEFELTLSGASAGTMFGVSNGKTLEDIQPVLQIESIRLEP
jgi:hypothetical protein